VLFSIAPFDAPYALLLPQVFQQRTKIFNKLYFEGRDTNKYSFVAAVTGIAFRCFGSRRCRIVFLSDCSCS